MWGPALTLPVPRDALLSSAGRVLYSPSILQRRERSIVSIAVLRRMMLDLWSVDCVLMVMLFRWFSELGARHPLMWSSYLQQQLTLVHAATIGRWAL